LGLYVCYFARTVVLAIDVRLVQIRCRVAGNNDVGQREQFVIGGQRFRISDVAGGQREPASAEPYPYCLIAFDKECCESSRDAPTATAVGPTWPPSRGERVLPTSLP